MSILASHLLEICRILNLAPTVVETIFGLRVLPALDTWRDLCPRAWAWLPNQARPRLYRIEDDGIIRLSKP